MSFRRRSRPTGRQAARAARRLVDLHEGEQAVVERLDAPAQEAQRLMELGFLPGNLVTAALSAPGGDPRVFRVDGSEIALRNDTAARIHLKQ